jgi:hypothetical protein
MSEEPGGAGCPNFLTGAGGVLSSVWAGWGGVRLRDDRLDLVYPIPPPGATAMRLARLSYLGRFLQIDISVARAAASGNQPWSPSTVSVTVLEETDARGFVPARELVLSCDGGEAMALKEGVAGSCSSVALVTIAVTK